MKKLIPFRKTVLLIGVVLTAASLVASLLFGTSSEKLPVIMVTLFCPLLIYSFIRYLFFIIAKQQAYKVLYFMAYFFFIGGIISVFMGILTYFSAEYPFYGSTQQIAVGFSLIISILYCCNKYGVQEKKSKEVPSMPPWEEIVEMLYDKNLTFDSTVVNIFYSKDKTMRYVILKNEKGLLTYQLEKIHQFDEEDWKYISSNDGALPAMWAPIIGNVGKSVFNCEEELLKEMSAEPEYRLYFE